MPKVLVPKPCLGEYQNKPLLARMHLLSPLRFHLVRLQRFFYSPQSTFLADTPWLTRRPLGSK